MPKKKPVIGIVFGGVSAEHEVSLASARNVMRAIEAGGEYDYVLFGINKAGDWYVGEGAWHSLFLRADPSMLFVEDDGIPQQDAAMHIGFPPANVFKGCDYMFPLTHGLKGEDGCLQGFLEMQGLKIIGCGTLASAACFDKHFLKSLASAAGCNVVPGAKMDLKCDTTGANDFEDICARLNVRSLFIKPNRSGSSLGVARAESAAAFADACLTARKFDDCILVEKDVKHREIVVGVIGNRRNLRISDFGECKASGDVIYSYQEKYLKKNKLFSITTDLGPDIENRLRQEAAAIYQAAACKDFARVDFFIENGTNDVYVNEVNTIPGLTASSVFPKIFQSQGIDYTALISLLLKTGIDGYANA
jgi:D-alanine-D-alanine ligase